MKKALFSLLASVFLLTIAGANGKEEPSASSPSGDLSFPLAQALTLSCYLPMSPEASMICTDYNELPLWREYEKKTGVKINFIHPPQGQVDEHFNLTVATGELPDIMYYNWNKYPGGAAKAFEDGMIVDWTDLMNQTPHLSAIMVADPISTKEMMNDKGQILGIPLIRETNDQAVFLGPIVRKDWLDELGLAVPETIDEWEEMLVAFKKEKGNVGLTANGFLGQYMENGSFIGAFGTQGGFYLEGKEIRHGALEPGFKDFLVLFHDWYEKGLVDPDFATGDRKAMHAKVLGDRSGTFVGYTSGDLGSLINNKRGTGDNDFDLKAAPYPVLNKGERAQFGQFGGRYNFGNTAVITADCENPALAAKWHDYRLGGDGLKLFNYGIEGESYTVVDGREVYTDLITANEEGLSMKQALAPYACSNYGISCLQLKNCHFQFIEGMPQKLDAVVTWAETEGASRRIPAITMTTEEGKEFASIMSDVNTYYEEMVIKYIIGVDNLVDYADFTANLEKMGLPRAVELQQQAYDRYLNR